MYRFLFLLFFLCSLLCGCATAYKSLNWNGGYTDLTLNEDTFSIYFAGNRFTSYKRVKDFVLLRAAEITISKGFNYFVIIDDKDCQIKEFYSYEVPKESYTNGYFIGNRYYESKTSYGGYTNYYDIKKHTSAVIIKCFKKKPNNDSAIIHNAEILCRELSRLYKLETPVCCQGVPS
jgi:hypothetical protein